MNCTLLGTAKGQPPIIPSLPPSLLPSLHQNKHNIYETLCPAHHFFRSLDSIATHTQLLVFHFSKTNRKLRHKCKAKECMYMYIHVYSCTCIKAAMCRISKLLRLLCINKRLNNVHILSMFKYVLFPFLFHSFVHCNPLCM